MHKAVITIHAIVIITCVIFLCGCSQLGITSNEITGHVYMNGHAISGARVDAISVNGAYSVNTTTDNNGAYTLNINPNTTYNLTATWQGLRHTVWPVYLPGDINTYDINLTSVPTSTIEGSGYEMGGPDPESFGHKRVSGLDIYATPVHGNTSIIAYTNNNGNYLITVEPYVSYNLTLGGPNYSPPIFFTYRNTNLYAGYNVTVGPNETAVVDYVIPIP